MRVNYAPIVVPAALIFVLFVAQILFINFVGVAGYGETFTLVSLPSDLALFVVTAYSFYLVRVLPPDLKERKFWFWTCVSLCVYSLGVALRMYILTLFPGTASLITYAQLLYVLAVVIYVLALTSLVVTMGVPIETRTKRLLILLGIFLCVFMFVLVLPHIIMSEIKLIAIVSYSIVSLMFSLSVPVAILLYLSVRRGVLKIPYMYMMFTTFIVGTQTIALVFMNTNSIPHPTLQLYFVIPFMIFCAFAFISMATRAHIAMMLRRDIDGGFFLEPTKH